jgi:quercetin dioxygenase-like cupin family protein
LFKQGAANRGEFLAAHSTERETTVSKLKLNRMSVGFLVAFALGLIAWRVAWATPGQAISTTIISGPTLLPEIDVKSETHDVKIKTKALSDVYVVFNTIAPGGHTGWHSHPGPSIISVKSGTATEYHSDEPNTPHVHEAGTSFVDDGDHAHIIRNEGSTNLELVAFQILPAGAPRRIDQPQP